jgi:hypothetical protein
VPVRGRLIYRGGQPIPHATVQFVPADSRDKEALTATGQTDQEGYFQLKTYVLEARKPFTGAKPGRYKVQVVLYPGGPRVPQQYMDADTTPLAVEVPDRGKDDVILELQPGSSSPSGPGRG